MPLPAPNLDDRRFQDILDEARRLIPRYCPEWTDHNLSDPGITLLELFAWMTDLLLYRLNRVPDRNYLKFLDLIGVRLEPARPAHVELTFRMAAPQPTNVVIPQGTSVGTVRTATQESVTFATDTDLAIRIPRLAHVLVERQPDGRFHDYQLALRQSRRGLGVFNEQPRPGDALYLGFDNTLSAETLLVTLECLSEGVGVDPSDPPLVWETWDGRDQAWKPLEPEADTTGGLNRNGVVILQIPPTATPTEIDDAWAFWVRCRVVAARSSQPRYAASPRITRIRADAIGGVVTASHVSQVIGEVLGNATARRGETFRLSHTPIMPRRPGETLQVSHPDGSFEDWYEVQSFGASTPSDRHFRLDDVTGEIEFGPAMRSPDGAERLYGRVPPAGTTVRFSRYHTGGGLVGNVGARTLTVMKSSIPYVEWVTNVRPAGGGTDSEDLEHAKWRGPGVLHRFERAVAAEDFERLTLESSPELARALCLRLDPTPDSQPARPGGVRLLLVPMLPDSITSFTPEQLIVPTRVQDEVRAYLDERRLLSCELVLDEPTYTWVSVLVRLRSHPLADQSHVAQMATACLYRFLHPTYGGPDGTGWPFGQELTPADVYPLLQDLDGVQYVEDVVIQAVLDRTTRQAESPQLRISPGPNGLFASYEHRVQVLQAQTHLELDGRVLDGRSQSNGTSGYAVASATLERTNR